jgi:glycine cleavage system regulatory protein
MASASKESEFAVLSTISPDRVGVVAAVTRFLAEHNANVEASHATRLAGFYGAQFLVSAASHDLEGIEQTYRDALREFSPALCRVTGAVVEPRDSRDPASAPYTLTVLAYDRKGIIAETAGLLAKLGISIVTLSADKYRAAETGVPLFFAEMQVRIPAGGSPDALSAALAELERRHGWDVELQTQARPGEGAHRPTSAGGLRPPVSGS